MQDAQQQRQPVLEAVELQKTYGRRRVVDGVNLEVGQCRNRWPAGAQRCGQVNQFSNDLWDG